MKPLFPIKGKEETKGKTSINLLIERVEKVLIPKLSDIGYGCTYRTIEELGSGVILELYQKAKKGSSILVIPWVRPFVLNKGVNKILADYPRLNISKKVIHLENDKKVEFMQELVEKFNLYFLVVLEKPHGRNLYWLMRYQDIPKQFWKPTYRKKGKPLDRIHFPNFEGYKFLTVPALAGKLNLINK